jgi:hypothetical protein
MSGVAGPGISGLSFSGVFSHLKIYYGFHVRNRQGAMVHLWHFNPASLFSSAAKGGVANVNKRAFLFRIRRMRCTKCGTESTTTRKFCAACGSALSSCCPSCGAENAPSSASCEDCGAPLAGNAASATGSPQAASTAPEIRVTPEQQDPSTTVNGERKTVTALFADIKGSTELMETSILKPREQSSIRRCS